MGLSDLELASIVSIEHVLRLQRFRRGETYASSGPQRGEWDSGGEEGDEDFLLFLLVP